MAAKRGTKITNPLAACLQFPEAFRQILAARDWRNLVNDTCGIEKV